MNETPSIQFLQSEFQIKTHIRSLTVIDFRMNSRSINSQENNEIGEKLLEIYFLKRLTNQFFVKLKNYERI